MANFYLSNPEHDSEKKVRAHLENQLGSKWHIFQGIEMNKFRGDGEIDFLVVHQTLGAIILEVKGGKIETREHNGQLQWSSTNAKGNKFDIQNPYEQSSKQGWKLKQYIKDMIGKDLHQTNAVAFPDIPELNINSPDINPLNTFGYNKLANNLEHELLKLLQNVHRGGARNQTSESDAQQHHHGGEVKLAKRFFDRPGDDFDAIPPRGARNCRLENCHRERRGRFILIASEGFPQR